MTDGVSNAPVTREVSMQLKFSFSFFGFGFGFVFSFTSVFSLSALESVQLSGWLLA